jgi:DNA-binding protein HU-beta
MSKKDLVDIILEDKEAGITTKAAASRAVDSVVNAIMTGLKKEGSIQLIGFGTFLVKEREARIGRNPKTGESVSIEATKKLAFKPSITAKNAVKQF